MKKALFAAVLLAVSGSALAHQWSANGFRLTQVGTGTIINTVEVKQDGFNSLDLCEQFIADQQVLASQFKVPAGQSTRSTVYAVCSQVKQATN